MLIAGGGLVGLRLGYPLARAGIKVLVPLAERPDRQPR